MDSAFWGLIGAVIGAAASILTTKINARNNIELQLKSEEQRRRNRATDFQRDNIIKIQETIYTYLRLNMEAYLQINEKTEAQNKVNAMLDQELNSNLENHTRDLAILIERVKNKDLRHRLNLTKKKLSKISFAKTKEERYEHLIDAINYWDVTMELVGCELRKMF